jgi:hypothetical protein
VNEVGAGAETNEQARPQQRTARDAGAHVARPPRFAQADGSAAFGASHRKTTVAVIGSAPFVQR